MKKVIVGTFSDKIVMPSSTFIVGKSVVVSVNQNIVGMFHGASAIVEPLVDSSIAESVDKIAERIKSKSLDNLSTLLLIKDIGLTLVNELVKPKQNEIYDLIGNAVYYDLVKLSSVLVRKSGLKTIGFGFPSVTLLTGSSVLSIHVDNAKVYNELATSLVVNQGSIEFARNIADMFAREFDKAISGRGVNLAEIMATISMIVKHLLGAVASEIAQSACNVMGDIDGCVESILNDVFSILFSFLMSTRHELAGLVKNYVKDRSNPRYQ